MAIERGLLIRGQTLLHHLQRFASPPQLAKCPQLDHPGLAAKEVAGCPWTATPFFHASKRIFSLVHVELCLHAELKEETRSRWPEFQDRRLDRLAIAC